MANCTSFKILKQWGFDQAIHPKDNGGLACLGPARVAYNDDEFVYLIFIENKNSTSSLIFVICMNMI